MIVRLKRSRAKKGVPASLLRVLVMILAAGVPCLWHAASCRLTQQYSVDLPCSANLPEMGWRTRFSLSVLVDKIDFHGAFCPFPVLKGRMAAPCPSPVRTGTRLSTKHVDPNFSLESLLTHDLCAAFPEG